MLQEIGMCVLACSNVCCSVVCVCVCELGVGLA